MKKKLSFSILKKQQKARVGRITLNGISFTTPMFMPVGTNATIKGLSYDYLDAAMLGTQTDIPIILNNTFHLYLRPGADVIHQAGGLHTFQQRKRLILTDSGGFQIFSLGLNKKGDSLVHIHKDKVLFRSPHDGSKHVFTPQGTVDIQRMLGADIMMMLDVCAPVDNITKKEVAAYMNQTHQRAARQFNHHMTAYDDYRGVLFPIIQGGLYTDLREESAKTLAAYAYDGIAIGGLSVGETKEQMQHTLQHLSPHLPEDMPRYLMGVGTPQDIAMAIEQGVDLFDCVMPTRIGRHGSAFTHEGTIKLRNSRYKDDFSSLEGDCHCYTCTHFTKAYLHHLIKAKEIYGGTLLSLHNIAYLHQFLEQWKQQVLSS